MTWVRLDDRFADNPKVANLSDRAFRAYIEALCYACGTLTDGKISVRVATRWPAKIGRELQDSGLWDKISTGYYIHDYLTYNPTREKVTADREAKVKAGAIGGARRWAKAKSEQSATEVVIPPPHPTPSQTAPPTGGIRDGNPNQPTHDQLYLAEKLEDESLSVPAIVKLNKEFGRASVEDAMRQMRGFPPEQRVETVYGYLVSMLRGFDD